ncbi:MAG: hypothetical protein RR784_11260, partial [Burkholderiaceae bacterium]
VQAGYRNRYGHPAAAVVARWQQAGATLVRSDEAGWTQWRLGPGGVSGPIRWREIGARYWHDSQPGRREQTTPAEPIDDGGSGDESVPSS